MRLINRLWPPGLLLAAAAWLYGFNSTTDGDMFVLIGVEYLVGTSAQAQNLATVGIIAGVALVSLAIGVTRILVEGALDDDEE